jgi:tetraacyldisaccharide 4'-kinase
MVRLILFPFSILYWLVTEVRNKLYDLGLKPSATFDLIAIGVGNLAVGGTGKTPMIEHLVRLLSSHHKVATLSRGYGRSTKGIRLADAADSASTIGDEPFQFYKKFRDKITVAVGEERALAIPYIIDQHPDTRIILLDDAFQHRKVKPSIQILLTDYHRPFYNDYLLPAGRLRESRKGAQRADVVVVTKCPDEISDEEMIGMEAEIRKYTDKPVFFTAVHYGELTPFEWSGKKTTSDVVLVSGIANSRLFKNYVSKTHKVIRHFDFPDHHAYTETDIRSIATFASQHNAMVVTTEKDASKLDAEAFKAFTTTIPFYYLPIELEFLKSGKDFDEVVLNAVKNG